MKPLSTFYHSYEELRKNIGDSMNHSRNYIKMQEYMKKWDKDGNPMYQPAPAARPLSAFAGQFVPKGNKIDDFNDIAVHFEGIDEDYIRMNPQDFPVKDIPFPYVGSTSSFDDMIGTPNYPKNYHKNNW